jgi:hypothetical protein
MNNESYYSDLRAKTNALAAQYPDGCLLVVSVSNRLKGSTGGTIAEVDTANGARIILDGTHREANPEEARLYREAQELARARTSSDPLEAARRQFGLLVGTKGNSHA